MTGEAAIYACVYALAFVCARAWLHVCGRMFARGASFTLQAARESKFHRNNNSGAQILFFATYFLPQLTFLATYLSCCRSRGFPAALDFRNLQTARDSKFHRNKCPGAQILSPATLFATYFFSQLTLLLPIPGFSGCARFSQLTGRSRK